MDRQIAYTGAIPQTGDILKAEKATMVALGYAMRAIVGDCSTSVQVDGLACAPITPVANLSVTVGVGSLYSAETVDANAYGDLGTDTTHTIVKQGILADPVTLTVTPPATSGYSQVFLVQVAFSEVDGGSVVLPYYNAANPSVPFSGPANAGTSNFTVRQGKIVVQLKAGTAATTGTQTTPAPDAGYTGLYAITVANGATSVISGNIAALASAPFIALKLPQVRSAIRAQADNYLPTIGGSANALTATIAPIPPDWASLTGVPFRFMVSTTNTGAATLNLNGLGAKSIVYPGSNQAMLAGELVAGAIRTGMYDGARVQLIDAGSTQLTGAPVGQCQLRYVSATAITLVPKDGDRVKVAGQLLQLPAAGVSAANTSVTINGTPGGNLASSTAYLVALNASGGLEFWTLATGHGPDTTAGNVGVEVITGHADKTLVGMVATNASSQFAMSETYIGVISWFNRRRQYGKGASTAGTGTSSLTFLEIGSSYRVYFLAWADDVVSLKTPGQGHNSTPGFAATCACGLDGATIVGIAGTAYTASGGQSSFTAGFAEERVSEGLHFATPLGAVGGGGVSAFTNRMYVTLMG